MDLEDDYGVDANHLLEAIAKMPPPPCEDGCQWRSYCAEKETACEEFANYISAAEYEKPYNNPERKPSIRIYNHYYKRNYL